MTILQAIINGILIGGVYALIGVGLTLVFGVMDIVNFAQAEFLMLGMYIAYFLFQVAGIDPILSSLIVFAVVFVIGALVQRMSDSTGYDGPHGLTDLSDRGAHHGARQHHSASLRSNVSFRDHILPDVGVAPRTSPGQRPLSHRFRSIDRNLFPALAFLQRTDLGRSMRATSQNRTAAILVGINDNRMYVLALGLGTGLAAIAGAVILPYAYVFPTVGHQYALIMFTGVVLGGFGSVPGALLGGLIVGIIQSVSSVYLPTQLQNLVVFIVFIMTLVYRPSGLLGR